jgi:hypothetical protein
MVRGALREVLLGGVLDVNRNSRRAAKELARQFAAQRKQGRAIVAPPSKRSSKWKGRKRPGPVATVETGV